MKPDNHMRARLQRSLTHLALRYSRLRCMPWRDAQRYLRAYVAGNVAPQSFSVLGFTLLMRPGTTDLEVACESLGTELEPVISYLPSDFDGVIVDAGGYIGTSALKFAKAFPNATIFVLEPSDQNFELLRQNVRGSENIKPVKAALSSESGHAMLLDRGTGPWGFTIVSKPADAADPSQLNGTVTYSIGSFLEAMNIKEIGIFKVDIEGGEAQLLQSASDWLNRTEMLVIELHDWIVPGVGESFIDATRGRANIKLPGEKFMSIRKS